METRWLYLISARFARTAIHFSPHAFIFHIFSWIKINLHQSRNKPSINRSHSKYSLAYAYFHDSIPPILRSAMYSNHIGQLVQSSTHVFWNCNACGYRSMMEFQPNKCLNNSLRMKFVFSFRLALATFQIANVYVQLAYGVEMAHANDFIRCTCHLICMCA